MLSCRLLQEVPGTGSNLEKCHGDTRRTLPLQARKPPEMHSGLNDQKDVCEYAPGHFPFDWRILKQETGHGAQKPPT